MSPIMVDGTGMCGGCRLTVGGETKFACVDGPGLDGRKVDWDESLKRGKILIGSVISTKKSATCSRRIPSKMPNSESEKERDALQSPTSATKTS